MKFFWIIPLTFSYFVFDSVGPNTVSDNNVYYSGVKYNDSLLFDSNMKTRDWTYSIRRDLVKPKDSIMLFHYPDCCNGNPIPMIIIKDSINANMIRRFERTEKVAVSDILKYTSGNQNKIWILYTEKEAEKNGTIVWDMKRVYPQTRHPALKLTIVY